MDSLNGFNRRLFFLDPGHQIQNADGGSTKCSIWRVYSKTCGAAKLAGAESRSNKYMEK